MWEERCSQACLARLSVGDRETFYNVTYYFFIIFSFFLYSFSFNIFALALNSQVMAVRTTDHVSQKIKVTDKKKKLCSLSFQWLWETLPETLTKAAAVFQKKLPLPTDWNWQKTEAAQLGSNYGLFFL